MDKPKLGQKISTTHTVHKSRRSHETKYSRKANPVTGIYIGKRAAREGKTYWDHDWYWYFQANKTFTIYLIVFDENHKPVFALPEDCCLAE